KDENNWYRLTYQVRDAERHINYLIRDDGGFDFEFIYEDGYIEKETYYPRQRGQRRRRNR
ncbi:MAG: hypothetical protein QGG64_11445, partial [Candidatus Latescibacteria bacterium]|nr:hypothetical protein [Candidatus Latescibacterota bacterium]